MLGILGLLFWGSASVAYGVGEKAASSYSIAKSNRISDKYRARTTEIIEEIVAEDPDYFKTHSMTELYGRSGVIYKQLEREGLPTTGYIMAFHSWYRKAVKPYASMEHWQIQHYMSDEY